MLTCYDSFRSRASTRNWTKNNSLEGCYANHWLIVEARNSIFKSKIQIQKELASSGNRTWAGVVAGEHSTTEPTNVRIMLDPNSHWNRTRNNSLEGRPRGRRAFYHWTNDAYICVLIRFEAMLDPHLHWNGWFTLPKTKISVSYKLWFYKTACVDRESNPEQQLGRLLC